MSTLSPVELRVLGPIQVRQGGAPVAVPGAKARAVLTIEGDRVTHIEDFDPDLRDLASARFAELTGEDQPK